MKRKFTLLIAALALLTMIVQPGRAWGQVVSGTTYNTTSSTNFPTGWSYDGEFTTGNTPYLKLVASANYIQTSNFSQNGFTDIKLKARKFGGPSEAEALITVSWYYNNTETVLGTISPTSTTLTDYTISSPTNPTGNTTGYIKIQCKGASGSKGSGVSAVTITYTAGGSQTDTHTLTFSADPTAGGTVTVGTSTSGSIDLEEEATISISATANTGYVFSNWTVAGEGSSVADAAAAATTFTMGTANATLTANFTQVNTYTVTYYANNGTETKNEVEYNQGDNVTVATNSFSFAGHAFTKWNTQTDGNGTDYDPGDVIESINADIDLYAQWEESSETVDVLNYAFTGITGTGYSAWSNKTGASGAVYAGRSGGDHNSIQLNSTSPNGIVSTASGGKFTKVVVSWNSSTANNRSVQVYGKTTAYDGSSDLYDNDKRGTLLGTITNGTSTELTISGDYNYIGIKNPGSAIYMDEVRITWVAASGDVVATPAIIPNGGNFWDSQEVSITCATDGATIYYTTDGTDPTSESSVYSAPFTITANTTVKAFAVKTDMTDSEIATAEFTKATPMTVAQALAATPQNNVYVSGIISGITEVNTSYHNATYTISDDGTQSGQMTVFRGRYLNNTDFTATDQIQVGDIVVVYGNLSTYQEVNQLAQGNYLVSLERPAAPVATPTFNPEAGVYTESQNVEISCETEGSTIYYTTDGTEPTNTSTEYTGAISVTETTTIKAIAIKNSDASTVATANYYICSQENPYTVTEALAFAEYQYPANSIYVHGIVSTAPTQAPTNNGELTYYISDNGEATNQLEVYKGKGLEQAAFTAQDDIQVGDIVTIYGNVQVYNNVIEFGSGNYLVSFYREPVLETENVNIACDATEGVITYTVTNPASDGNLTAEITDGNEDNWLTLGTIGANVPFTCTANTGAERTATVTLTYTYNTTETVTATAVVTQAAYVAPVASITVDPATVNAPAAETDGTLTVTYTDIATDLGASIFWYTDNTGTETTTEPEWISADIDDITLNVEYLIDANTGDARSAYFKVYGLDTNGDDVYSNLVTINQEALVVDYATLPFEYEGGELSDFIELTGTSYVLTDQGSYATGNAPYRIKFTKTGDYLQVKTDSQPGIVTIGVKMVGGSSTSHIYVQGSVNGETFDEGEALEISGKQNDILTLTSTRTFEENVRYVRLYFDKGSNVGVGPITIAKVDNSPSITINLGPYNLNSEGGNAELPVTYKNMPTDPQAVVIFYESDGETELTENPTWITATINANGNVDGHIDANDGDARSAYFKVKGIDADGNDVYSGLVTVNQAAYTLSIVFETTSLDIEAGGEQDRIISFEYQGLGENPTFEVRTYDVTGETPTTYDWLTTSITQGHKVSINVAENTGDARSAYFKVYGENGTVNTESNLVTINQAAAGVTYTLVETDDDIEPGLHYIIVGIGANSKYFAMGSQANNYRNHVEVTPNGTTIAQTDGVYEFVISGDGTHNWTIYDENTPGYLYAAGINNGENYLKTQETNNNRGIWTIVIDAESHTAAIRSITTETDRNILRYNSNSTRFSCYNGGQQDIYLYKKNNDNDPVYYSPTEIAVADPDPTSEPIIVVNNEILVLSGDLSNCNNPGNLIIEDGGQLVFSGTGVQATMKKSTAHAGAKDVATDWYTIASPLSETVTTNTSNTNLTTSMSSSEYDLYRYEEATAVWENSKDGANSSHFSEIELGRGYLYWREDGQDLIFAGELNNENVDYTLTADGTGNLKGFNLIGNPFSQNITMSNITGVTLSGGYVLTQAGGWGASIDEIAPCQGFLVQVEAETNITITKPTSSSKSRANRDYIAFTVANNQYEDVAYAMFEEATGLSKINHRNADIPMVYIPQNGQNYAIATMDDNTQAFELNFKAMTTGQYTLSYKAEGKYSYLHVIDRLTGEDIDMLLDGEYSFIGSPRDNEARFIVKLSYNANIDEIEVNDNFAYQNGSDIIVNGNGELQVFDVTGRMVMNTKINGIQTVNVPATGMYIFRMVGESVQTQKIVVR